MEIQNETLKNYLDWHGWKQLCMAVLRCIPQQNMLNIAAARTM